MAARRNERGKSKRGAKRHQRAGVIFGLAMLEGDEKWRWGKGRLDGPDTVEMKGA